MVFLIMIFVFSACVSRQAPSGPVVGKGSSLSDQAEQIVAGLKTRFDFTGRNIQISPNNFWEKDTRMNLPFSTVLSESLASEFSRAGAGSISVQEIGDAPLKATGTYIIAGKDVLITVRLRRMGQAASRDLAVAEGRISRTGMMDAWTRPEFHRIARSLVHLLEMDYQGSDTLDVVIPDFVPGNTAQPELVLGHEMAKYMRDAVAGSSIFTSAGSDQRLADAVIQGDYSAAGGQMTFHVSAKDKKTGQIYSGARISTDLDDIPPELTRSALRSIDDLVRKMAARIAADLQDADAAGTGRVYIGINNFHDSAQNAVTPFSRHISRKFKELLPKAGGFTATDHPSDPADFILTGHYFPDRDQVVVTADLYRFEPGSRGCRKINLTSVQSQLARQYVDSQALVPRFRGYVNYLLSRLEDKASGKLPCNTRNNLVIHKMKFENEKASTDYSDYLNPYFMDYFTASVYFSPVTDTREKLKRSLTRGTRKIVAVAQNSEATVANVAGAEHYFTGSFWPLPGGGVKLSAVLMHIDGSVVASEQVELDDPGIAVDRPKAPPIPMAPLPKDRLTVELFTLKGSSNLTYSSGEEIVFCAKASRNVYLQMFAADAQNNVYRIYPNAFEPGNLLRAGEITTIPNDRYDSSFRFEVQPPTGNEVVFAFASDNRLPDLPGARDVGNGVQHINHLSIGQIKDWFAAYAGQRGMMLSWDSLPILTKD